MRNLKFLVLSAAAFGLIAASQRAEAVTITIGDAEGAAGDFVPVDVTLATEGEDVAGTQNDIIFPAGGEVAVSADEFGQPLCTVNPAINKGGTTFAFLPNACEPGSTCTGVRALVLALNNVNPIPDGSVLYTCELAIAEDSPDGAFTLNNMMAGASSPTGVALSTTGIAGEVNVMGGGGEVATIVIGSATGEAGGNASIDVTLETGVEVAGTQNDIAFSPQAAIRADEGGNPMCAVNPAINKGGTTFAFLPNGCDVGSTCTGIRALVLALNNVNPIPDGSRLYSCDIAISGDASGEFPLTCSNQGASSPAGGALSTACTDGTITIGGGATPTNTVGEATPTATPPTAVGTPTNTAGVNTPTRTSTGIVPPPTFVCDDGCSVAAPVDTTTGWVLLLPAALLLWVRRRSR